MLCTPRTAKPTLTTDALRFVCPEQLDFIQSALKNADAEELALYDLYFEDQDGIALKERGNEIQVTLENATEYLELLLEVRNPTPLAPN